MRSDGRRIVLSVLAVIAVAGLSFWAGRGTSERTNADAVSSQQEIQVRSIRGVPDKTEQARKFPQPAADDLNQEIRKTGNQAAGPAAPPALEPLPSSRPPSAPPISPSIEAARAAMGRKAYDKAAEMLRQALAEETDPEKRMVIGLMLYECRVRTQAYEEALTLGRELLTLSPSPEERLTLNRQLAALLHRMGKPDEAETLLSQSMAEEQDSAIRAKYDAQLRSVWRHTPGRTDEVVTNLTARVSANPQDELALRQLGDIYLKSRRDYKAAQPVYEQLAALYPEEQQIQAALVSIYRENHNYDGVRRVYENRLEQTGEDPTLRFQIAQTELQAGRGDEAVAYAEKHLAGEQATLFQLQLLSTVYDKAGRKDAAIATLDTAITRETNAQQQLSMQFQKAEMLIWNKQYVAAETLLRSIIKSAGDDQQTISRAKGEIVRIFEMQGKMSELNL